MPNRNSKPNSEGRAAMVGGYVTAMAGPDALVAPCPWCGFMTAPHALAGLAGFPSVGFTLAHDDATSEGYGWYEVHPSCATCNADAGTRPMRRDDILDERARAILSVDYRADGGAFLARVRAVVSGATLADDATARARARHTRYGW